MIFLNFVEKYFSGRLLSKAGKRKSSLEATIQHGKITVVKLSGPPARIEVNGEQFMLKDRIELNAFV
ncbi:glycosyl hydrolase family 65 protein [Bacillus sp. T33-2]|uniref:glycosyl hydrolase family 65 protein n=1 Tax=Bacillus sp. T33-2 TaxID=2054168 RepID=UPI000C765081|nr:glycosyl hydrolase family 65 protein [Bacillus sp. T33-2]PLR97550.1 hypothetical protein CVD19_08705 [Bacillus sp. T33-2]